MFSIAFVFKTIRNIMNFVCSFINMLFFILISSTPIYASQPKSHFETEFIVILDPGHGGVDGGATGLTGILEKDITLRFARKLKSYLKNTRGLRVFLTRNDDRYLHLRDRMEIARSLGANLFISIHADSIADPSLRGATLYTISSHASDLIAKKLSENQNKVDFLVENQFVRSAKVSNILFDLERKENYHQSLIFSHIVIENLKEQIEFIRRPLRSANFQVLTAPDFPSILLELGYLSNIIDEKLLSDEQWTEKTAVLIAKSIVKYVKDCSNNNYP